ncbi:hypothetical protein [Haloquadratum walsbyi]|nr:hypothetical protein [Haloquadratum walsbyi]
MNECDLNELERSIMRVYDAREIADSRGSANLSVITEGTADTGHFS